MHGMDECCTILRVPTHERVCGSCQRRPEASSNICINILMTPYSDAASSEMCDASSPYSLPSRSHRFRPDFPREPGRPPCRSTDAVSLPGTDAPSAVGKFPRNGRSPKISSLLRWLFLCQHFPIDDGEAFCCTRQVVDLRLAQDFLAFGLL